MAYTFGFFLVLCWYRSRTLILHGIICSLRMLLMWTCNYLFNDDTLVNINAPLHQNKNNKQKQW